ncbi:hypothetical protein C8F04DRAFT_969620 [Mycena alexandri]|uniref:Uncharacterized protein n=1 Tax=Mycena alexandri TaxID=1745969 RepID=A0AAD6SAG4_9AGAR|nr:hypothetical protein C8F04DRAFT_969620 [Mycena alexandri]
MESPADAVAPKWVKTEPNDHGLYKVFPNRPTHDPEESITLANLCRSPDLLVPEKENPPDSTPWFPFLNPTVARLMAWFHLGSLQKSIAELDALVEDVLLQEDFDPAHLADFSAARENKRLDDAAFASAAADTAGRWLRASVKIKLPAPKVRVPEEDAPEFEVEGLVYRPLLDVMVEAFQSSHFEQYHITPFEYRWDPKHNPDDPDIELGARDVPLNEDGLPVLPDGHQVMCGEIYTSPKMLRAHNELPQPPTPNLETIIAAYMFYSDSTHLANFGTASLWPLYTFFGNQSKYQRAKPTMNADHHQAYFPSVNFYSHPSESAPDPIFHSM